MSCPVTPEIDTEKQKERCRFGALLLLVGTKITPIPLVGHQNKPNQPKCFDIFYKTYD